MTANVYSSDEVAGTFAGIPLGDGRAPDDFIVISANEPERNSMSVGADGEVTYSQSHDNTHTVTVKLTQGSEANALLSAVLNTDLAKSGGNGIGPFSIIDKNGISVFLDPEARIMGWPDKTYGPKGDKILEWKFACPNPKRFEGGL